MIRRASLAGRGALAQSGGKRDRTADLLRAKQALSQLSYAPVLLRGAALMHIVHRPQVVGPG